MALLSIFSTTTVWAENSAICLDQGVAGDFTQQFKSAGRLSEYARDNNVGSSRAKSAGSSLSKDAASLGETLNWLQSKIRDYGNYTHSYRDSNGRLVNERIEQRLSFSLSSCVINISTLEYDQHGMTEVLSRSLDYRIPLAEMDADTATSTTKSCEDSATQCVPDTWQLIRMDSKNGRNVIKADVRTTVRPVNFFTLSLLSEDRALTEKIKRGLAHAAKLCQDDEPKFPD